MSVFSFTYSDTEIMILGSRFGGFTVASTPLPKGLVQAGRINDPTAFSKLLGQAMTAGKPGPIRAKHAIIGLPEKQAFIKTICLPKKLKRQEVEKALEYQWQSILPIPPDLAYYDFDIIKPIRKPLKTDTTQQVLIVAYPTEIINTLITVCKNLGITPIKIIPASFGLATLFSGKEPSASMIVESATGYDVPVTIAQRGTTRFSTIVHTQVNNPACAKQVDNIHSFYERSIGINGETIKRLVVLPGPYTPTLTQTLAPLKMPTEIVQAEKYFKDTPIDQQHSGKWIYLLGLLHNKSRITILPTSLLESHQATRQFNAFRVFAVSVAATFTIALYLSLILWGSVQFEKNNHSQYSQKFIDYLTTENIKTTDAINTINQQLSTLPLPNVRESTMGTQLGEIAQLTAATPDLGINKISIDKEKNTTQLTGTPKNLAIVTTFTDKYKAAHPGTSIDVSPAGEEPNGETPFTLTIVNGGTP